MNPQDVSNVKFQMKVAMKGTGKAAAHAKPAAADDTITLSALQAAKDLVEQVGGLDKAKRAIEGLGRLMD